MLDFSVPLISNKYYYSLVPIGSLVRRELNCCKGSKQRLSKYDLSKYVAILQHNNHPISAHIPLVDNWSVYPMQQLKYISSMHSWKQFTIFSDNGQLDPSHTVNRHIHYLIYAINLYENLHTLELS